jgi:hypothetical protein
MPTLSKRKVWDVVQPRDGWERNMAHLLYLHEGVKQLFTTRIPVMDEEDLKHPSLISYDPQVRRAIMVIEGFKV